MKTTTTNARPAALAAAARNASTNAERAAAVLTRAHDMTRRTLAAFPGADYRATLAAALRIAWADALAPSAADAWNGMQPEEQLDALRRMTYKAARRDLAYMRDGDAWHDNGSARRSSDGQRRQSDRFAWARTPDGDLQRDAAEQIVHEAWIRMTEYVTDERHADKPFAALLYQAAATAAQYINRAERRNARAIRWADIQTGADDDGKETTERIARIVNNAAPMAERFLQPEAAAVLHDTIAALAADDTDRAILAGMIEQHSRRDIAEHLGLSHTAVNKRVNRMLARYAAAADPDDLEADLLAYRIRKRLA